MLLILIISTLLLGYLWGKHDGQVEGYERATATLPLVLRQQSLEQGYCLLCREATREDEISPCFLSHNMGEISHTNKITE